MQLTFELHGFELHASIYARVQTFSIANAMCSIRVETMGSMLGIYN